MQLLSKKGNRKVREKNGHLENVAPPQSFNNHSEEKCFRVLIVCLLIVIMNKREDILLLKSFFLGQWHGAQSHYLSSKEPNCRWSSDKEGFDI